MKLVATVSKGAKKKKKENTTPLDLSASMTAIRESTYPADMA
jgi:hypothetical protein